MLVKVTTTKMDSWESRENLECFGDRVFWYEFNKKGCFMMECKNIDEALAYLEGLKVWETSWKNFVITRRDNEHEKCPLMFDWEIEIQDDHNY